MTFRLTTLLYLFALLAAALSVLGVWGILAFVGVLLAWATLLARPSLGCGPQLIVVGPIAAIILLLLPNIEPARQSVQRAQCMNNLKQLSLGVLTYESATNTLPPAVTVHAETGHRHSWRVMLLNYLESGPGFKYRLEEAWDGPANSQLFGSRTMELYCCPSHQEPTETNYFAITGPQTAWGDGEPRKLSDITDGTASTILLIEAAGRGVHWAEPRDLTFDEAVELLTTPVGDDSEDGHRVDHGYFYKSSFIRHVAMCDGWAQPLHVPLPREAAIALLTAEGGEPNTERWLEYYTAPQLDFGRIWAFSAFVLLALLPAVPPLRPWIWPVSRHSALPQVANRPTSEPVQ